MIYHFSSRTLIVTPPKTGSSSLHSSLCLHRHFYYLLSMTPWGRVSKHCSVAELGSAPLEFANGHRVRFVLTVRHPVDRVISMYRHHLGYGEFQGTFAEWVELRSSEGGGVKWLRSCHSHLSGATAEAVLRTEKLDTDLVELGMPPTRLHINTSRTRDDVPRELAETVARQWWPDDFQYYE